MRFVAVAILSALLLAGCIGTQEVVEDQFRLQPESNCGNERLQPVTAQALTSAYALVQSSPTPRDADIFAAINTLKSLVAEEPELCPYDRATAFEMIGYYKTQVTDNAGAMQYYRRALAEKALPPDRAAPVYLYVAGQYSVDDRLPEVMSLLQDYISDLEAAGAPVPSRAWYLVATTHARAGDLEEARVAARRAVTATDATVDQYVLLSALMQATGKPAADLRSMCLAAFPDDPDCRAMPASLRGLPLKGPEYFTFWGDRDAQPRLRIPAQYPATCTGLPAGEELRVTLLFDISAAGRPQNIRVGDSADDCLNAYAVRALEQWQYQPKLVQGTPVARQGTEATFVFILEN